MDETLLSWVFFLAYVGAVVGVSLAARRKAGSMESFAVGTRTVSPFWVGLSLAANMTSAATFVINPGLIYLYGWSGVLGYALATPLGIYLALVVFSKRFRKVGDEFTVLTIPQWIGDRYGSRPLKLYFAVLSLLQITFLVLIVVGVTLVLQQALGIPQTAALLLTVGLTFGYILLGGAASHIRTNAIQAGIMILVALLLLGSGLEFVADGGFFQRLADVGPFYAEPVNPDSLLFRSIFEVFVANFFVGVAVILQPHIMSKALYLRSEADVNKYLATAVVAASLFFAVLAVGLFARIELGGGLAPDTVIATYLTEAFAPLPRAIVVLGVLAAGFSTMEGILVALSSIFANDFLKTVLPARITTAPDWTDRGVRYARWFLVGLIPVTLFFSWQQLVDPSLSVAIFAQNGVYGLFAATFVPILAGIFVQRVTRGWVAAASVVALLVHFGTYYFELGPYWNNPAVPATYAIVASLLVMAAGIVAPGTPRFARSEPARQTPTA
jgi:SSS family solute:Na+ symporter/sodium/pantothenate symporter